jgi:probable rRNA maturation factor
MIDIAFVNETQEEVEAYEALITQVFHKTMEVEAIDAYYEVSVIFVTNEKIQEINKTYRNIDKATDVISFALFDEVEEEVEINDEAIVSTLGDLFISIEKAKEQAAEYGHSLEREMGFLACHGLLHLLGYDHDDLPDEQEMFNKQDQILNAINLKRDVE